VLYGKDNVHEICDDNLSICTARSTPCRTVIQDWLSWAMWPQQARRGLCYPSQARYEHAAWLARGP
jgi:hypothetical protein